MKPAATEIDDILFPGESRRLLDAQIAYVKRMLDAIESIPKTPQQPASTPMGNVAKNGSVHASQDCSGALLSMTLSNNEKIRYRLAEIYPGLWNAYDDNDTSGSGGWGPTQLEAIRDLRERSERETCSDGRARVMTEPQRRDREFRRKVLRTELSGDL